MSGNQTFECGFLLNDDIISQSSKNQGKTLFTLKLEYIAYSTAIQEGVWLRKFLHDLGIVACASKLVTIHYDSMATLAYAKDVKYHGQTKHINIVYPFI